jgi:pyridoxal phosphate enzyme (YggS family)
MPNIAQHLDTVRNQITKAAIRADRDPDSIQLLAVSKTRPVEDLREALDAGQTRFGESYLQEAVGKIEALDDCLCEWHFIGPCQSNKTAAIAQYFDWVHSVDRLKIAQRLSEQRPRVSEKPHPLNILLQVNTSGEQSKSGVSPDKLEALARSVKDLPNLSLRGLMTIPARETNIDRQRQPFKLLKQLYDQLNNKGYGLDTLSMGMTDDLEAAILEGATIVRIGTAIFGARK